MQVFRFVQMEFPGELGPGNGRYLLRRLDGPERGEPERVVVLGTLAAGVREETPFGARLGRRRVRAHTRPADSQPATVTVTRATAIDAKPLASAEEGDAWLRELDPESEAQAGAQILNRLLYAHRVAAAAPHLHEISPAQATVVRAGYGEGEQVADGRWTDARELVLSQTRKSRRSAVLRPQERLALLLSGREEALLCEDLALRARADLDAGRLAPAAIGLDRAYAAALAELPAERREDLGARVEELKRLGTGVQGAATAALAGDGEIDGDLVRQALERLEAALRARTAAGFSLR